MSQHPKNRHCFSGLSYSSVSEILTMNFTEGEVYSYPEFPASDFLVLNSLPSTGHQFNFLLRRPSRRTGAYQRIS